MGGAFYVRLVAFEGSGVRLSERRFEVGEVIYTQGDPDRYLYFLTDGVIKIYKRYE